MNHVRLEKENSKYIICEFEFIENKFSFFIAKFVHLCSKIPLSTADSDVSQLHCNEMAKIPKSDQSQNTSRNYKSEK
jgi:hypothetical protein